jgi:hypothetical protein
MTLPSAVACATASLAISVLVVAAIFAIVALGNIVLRVWAANHPRDHH